jgi:hypothetical protein
MLRIQDGAGNTGLVHGKIGLVLGYMTGSEDIELVGGLQDGCRGTAVVQRICTGLG